MRHFDPNKSLENQYRLSAGAHTDNLLIETARLDESDSGVLSEIDISGELSIRATPDESLSLSSVRRSQVRDAASAGDTLLTGAATSAAVGLGTAKLVAIAAGSGASAFALGPVALGVAIGGGIALGTTAVVYTAILAASVASGDKNSTRTLLKVRNVLLDPAGYFAFNRVGWLMIALGEVSSRLHMPTKLLVDVDALLTGSKAEKFTAALSIADTINTADPIFSYRPDLITDTQDRWDEFSLTPSDDAHGPLLDLVTLTPSSDDARGRLLDLVTLTPSSEW